MLTRIYHFNHNVKIFLFGYHGKRNIGDDIICVSLVEVLRKLFNTKVLLYVYTKERYIKQNLKKEVNLQIYFVSSIINVLKALISSNVVIIDGGDHLHDYGNFLKRLKIFVTFLMLAFFTKISFKKLLIINNGFRATRGISLAFLKMILNLAYYVSVRDGDSFALISEYVSKQSQRGFDTAVLFDYHWKSIVGTDNRNVGFSITPVFSNFFLKPEKDNILAKVIARDVNNILHNMKNINLYFLAFNTDPKVGDLTFIRKIVRMLNIEILERVKLIVYSGNIFKFLSKFSQLDFVVCCKYHSVIFSYLFGKPMVVINYHPKNATLAREIGLSSHCIVSLEEIFAGKIGLILPELVNNPEKFKAKLPIYLAKRRALRGILEAIKYITGDDFL